MSDADATARDAAARDAAAREAAAGDAAARDAAGQEEAAAGGVNWRFIRATILPLLLPLWFALFAIQTVIYFEAHDLIGIDVAIYRHAGEIALAGGNPWIPFSLTLQFAAPPPTLVLYVPVSLLPLPIATVLMMSAGVLGAAWAIRRLGLPLWWLLFPPLFDALIVGNPDAYVLPLLLVGGPLAGLAAVLKVYALVPLVLQRRWSAIVLAAAVAALSLPEVPNFLSTLGTVGEVLATSAKLSAWGTWLMIPVLVALWILRRRGAEYLVVPALWPNSQSQYGTMALAAVHRSPLAAALIGLNTPLLPPLAVIVMALEERLRMLRRSRDAVPSDGDPERTAAPDDERAPIPPGN